MSDRRLLPRPSVAAVRDGMRSHDYMPIRAWGIATVAELRTLPAGARVLDDRGDNEDDE